MKNKMLAPSTYPLTVDPSGHARRQTDQEKVPGFHSRPPLEKNILADQIELHNSITDAGSCRANTEKLHVPGFSCDLYVTDAMYMVDPSWPHVPEQKHGGRPLPACSVILE